MNPDVSADTARWWNRLRLCPERGPERGYRCDSFKGHKGQHEATWLIDAQDDLYGSEVWGEQIDGSQTDG